MGSRDMRLDRGHIEFIQQQSMPWVELSRPPLSGMMGKVMSEASDGSGTYLIALASNQTFPLSVPDRCTVQLITLAGRPSVDGQEIPELTYVRVASGDTLELTSDGKAVGLVFVDFVEWAGVESKGPVNLDDVPWRAERDEWFAAGAARKNIWTEPTTGEELFLLGTMPLRWNDRAQVHPVVEEVFVLAGELIGEHGVLTEGAYFWRPPGVWHGPFGQRRGTLMVIRTPGGPFTKEYSQAALEVDRSLNYQPVLPPELAETGIKSAKYARVSSWGGAFDGETSESPQSDSDPNWHLFSKVRAGEI